MELPKDGKKITSRVKLVSYLHRYIKQTYPGQLRELREMCTLSASLDLLREEISPDWGTRLRSAHGAVPIRGRSAAAASLVLASRKHQELVEKVQGKGQNWWPQWGGEGRGRSKGDWGDQQVPNQKGKRGKGDRKGKGKGKPWNQTGTERGAGDWAKTQDKRSESSSRPLACGG